MQINPAAEILDQRRNRRMVHGESSMKLDFWEAAPVKVTDFGQRETRGAHLTGSRKTDEVRNGRIPVYLLWRGRERKAAPKVGGS